MKIKFSNYVRLNIFDVTGNAVFELVDKYQNEGTHSMVWRGINDQGMTLPSGIYFNRIQIGDYSSSIKMLLIR